VSSDGYRTVHSSLPLRRLRYECRVDTCNWTLDPDADDLGGYKLIIDTQPGETFQEALDRAITAHATERAKATEKRLREHFESHDILDWVRTVMNLEQQLAQYDCGIRPHLYDRQPTGSQVFT